MRRPLRLPEFAVLVGFLLLPGGLSAQARSEIRGTVISDSTGDAVPGARVTVTLPSGRDTTLVADARGKFVLKRLAPGRYRIVTEWRGISSPVLAVDLLADERFEAEFTVRANASDLLGGDSVAVLPDLETRAVSGRASTFEQRMATGLGLYITREEIERRESAGLNDILRNAAGVRISCFRDGCFPVISRAPPGCLPAYYMDDVLSDPRSMVNMRSTEIHGIEIYQGLSQMPAELARDRARARCGVIAVWTRRGPDAPPAPPSP